MTLTTPPDMRVGNLEAIDAVLDEIRQPTIAAGRAGVEINAVCRSPANGLQASRSMNATNARKQTAWVIAALCCACCAEPASPPAKQPSVSHRQPTKLELDRLDYGGAVIREKIHCVDAVARRIADTKLHHVAWHESWHDAHTSSAGKPWMDYHALWCLRSDRPDHLCAGDTERPVHCISLRARPHPKDSKKLSSFTLTARWQPDRERWGLRMFYQINQPDARSAVNEQLSIAFYHRQFEQEPGSEVALHLPGGGVRVAKRFGRYEYIVATPTNSGPPPCDPRRFLASPKSLRDAGLAEIDELEPLIREQILSGEAVRSVTDETKVEETTVDAMRGGQPPEKVFFHPSFQPPFAAEYQLSEQQKQAILVEALAELERRRRLLRDHYQQMHAAVQAAFPLNECLEVKSEN